MAFVRKIPIFSQGENKQAPVQMNNEAKSKAPSHILNFKGPGTVIADKQSVKDSAQSSNFLITVNPNVSYKIAVSDQQKTDLYQSLDKAMKRLGSGFQTRELLQPFPAVNQQAVSCNVKQYDFHVEYGNKAGFMHSHAVLLLDGKCHVNLKKCRAMLDEEFAAYHQAGEHVHLDIKAFKDQKAVIDAYLRKSQSE
jgi:hypothetical protein